MRAISYEVPKGKGRPTLRLIDAANPVVAHAEVLVGISHVALSYIDYENQTGQHNKAIRKNLKKGSVVSGIEMAGVVESDGQTFKKGDRVFGYTNIFRGPWFHAEQVALSEDNLARIPDGVTPEGAAAIVGGGLTAIKALEHIAKIKAGENILITGATGSVGVTALQLAKHHGADITAICHSSQCEFAISQGARMALAYDTDEQLPRSARFDVVFDTAPSMSFSQALPFLKPTGTYITTMPHLDVTGFLRSLVSRRKWGFLLESNTDQNRLGRLSALMKEGVFVPAIDSVFAFEDATQAFARQEENGKRGKIILTMSAAP